MGPLASVNPPSFGLDSQAVPLALGPVAFVGVATGPRVYAHHLEAVVPGARVLALALGAGADAVPVGFAPLPAPAIGASIIEIKPAAAHGALRRPSAGQRSQGQRSGAPASPEGTGWAPRAAAPASPGPAEGLGHGRREKLDEREGRRAGRAPAPP